MKEAVKLINTFIIKYYDGQGHRLWKKNKHCELASSSWFVCSHSVLQHKTYESQGRQPMGSRVLVTFSSLKIPDGSQAREEGLRLTPGSGGVVHHDQEGTAVGNLPLAVEVSDRTFSLLNVPNTKQTVCTERGF